MNVISNIKNFSNIINDYVLDKNSTNENQNQNQIGEGVIVHKDDIPTATNFVTGIEAGGNNLENLFGVAKDYITGTTPIKPRKFIETKGISATVGELFNPYNVLLGAVSGGALGAAGEFTAGAAETALGVTGSELIGETAAKILPKTLIGATEGAGWTAIDHYEKVAGGVNDSMSSLNLLAGSVFGGAIGGIGSVIADKIAPKLSATDKALSPLANDVDTKLATITHTEDYHYNSQNKMGYTLSQEQPDLLSIPEAKNISPNTLEKVKVNEGSDIYKRDKDAILQAQRLYDAGYRTLDNVDQAILGSTMNYNIKYNNILSQSPWGKYISTGDNLNVRKAIHYDWNGLNEVEMQSGMLANELNNTIYDDAKALNIDRGIIDSYIQQSYSPEKLHLLSFEDFKNIVKPRLSDDINDNILRDAFENLSNRDIKHQDIRAFSNPGKSRVFHFKDAQSQWEIEQELGNPMHVGAKITAQIKKAAELHGRIGVLGIENPEKILKYFAKLNDINPKSAGNKIGDMLNLGKTYNSSDAFVLANELVQSSINISRAANSLFKPFYSLVNVASDLTFAHLNAVGSYGLSNTLKNIIKRDVPNDAILSLAKLPNEVETFKSIYNEFKNDLRTDTLNILGVNINKANITKFNKLVQSGATKLGGMHVLDRFIRKQNIKLIANIIRQSYKKDGLNKILPNVDKDILAQSVDKEGYLVPQKLTTKADNLRSEIDKINLNKQDILKEFDDNENAFNELLENAYNENKNIKSNSLSRYNDILKEVKTHVNNINKLKTDIKVLKENNPDLEEVGFLKTEISSIKRANAQSQAEFNKINRKIASLNKELGFAQAKNKNSDIDKIKSDIAIGKETLKQISNEMKEYQEQIKSLTGNIKNSFDQDKLDNIEQELANSRSLRDEALLELKNTDKSFKNNKYLNEMVKFLKSAKYQTNKELISKLNNFDSLIKNVQYQQQRYRDVANALYSEYAKINRANPIYSNDFKWLSKIDPSVSAGARTIIWPLRMLAGLYKSFLEGSQNNNKIFALSGVAISSMALGLVDTAEEYIMSELTGQKEKNRTVPFINKALKEAIPDDFTRNFAINSVSKMIPLSMIYNAPIFYGSGSHAIKAAYYELASDEIGGNENKAKEQLIKASPWVGMMSNVFGSNTN